jgi:hypothetical protein
MIDGAPFNVADYGAFPSASAAVNQAAIQAAIDAAVAAGGGVVEFNNGTYNHTGTITMGVRVTLRGKGRLVTKLLSAHTGAGIKISSTINGSTAVLTNVEDLTIQNTNASNTDGGYVDVAGTFVTLNRVQIAGFKHCLILDQTELADFTDCLFEIPLTSWVWLVNDGTYTPGSLSGFTNRIGFHHCQFNGTTAAVLDDGGYVHAFNDCNFNGGGNHIRAAAVIGLKISGGEYESSSSTNFEFHSTSWQGLSVGVCINVDIGGGAVIVPTLGQSCIDFVALGISAVTIGNVYLGNTVNTKISNIANVGALTIVGPVINAGGGPTTSGSATFMQNLLFSNTSLYFPPISAAGVFNNVLFQDSATGKLSFKDSSGVVNALY